MTREPGPYALGIVIPCFNEQSRLPREMLLDWGASHPHWAWQFVNDGSSDATGEILDSISQQLSHARCLHLPQNQGKAEAVRQGMLTLQSWCASPWVGFLDADLATPLQEFERIYRQYAESSRSVVLGSRILRLGASIKRNSLRHHLSRWAACLVNLSLRLATYDTQCGAKLFRSHLVKPLFLQPFQTRWLFEVELLARCRQLLGHRETLLQVIEEPLLEWDERPGSKLRARDLLRLPLELWKIHRYYNCSPEG